MISFMAGRRMMFAALALIALGFGPADAQEERRPMQRSKATPVAMHKYCASHKYLLTPCNCPG